jgi:hypothetical protein
MAGRGGQDAAERELWRCTMRTAILAVFVGLSLTMSADAESPGIVVGYGSGRCGDFGRDLAKWGQSVEMAYFAWAQGYMSAVQTPRPESDRINLMPASLDVEEQMRSIRKFCAHNPQRQFDEAVADLYDRLGALAGQRPYLHYAPP